jgi:hypothetical protein
MKNGSTMFLLIGGFTFIGSIGPLHAQENKYSGQRPYELDWAGRYEDDHVPLIDFERAETWTIETSDGAAAIHRPKEEIIWDDYTCKITYQANSTAENAAHQLSLESRHGGTK